MRETAIMQWRSAADVNARETAWQFSRTIDVFEGTLDGFINEISKAETQA